MDVGARPPRTWWVWTLVAVGVAALAVFATAVALVVAPPALANLRSQVATGDPVPFSTGAMSAQIAVPAGWLIVRQDDGTAVISTPDRGLVAEVSLTDAAPEGAAILAGVPAPLVEQLVSGLTAAHGVPADGGDIIAAVGPGEAGTVVFAVTAPDLERYRPALAELLEAVLP